MTGESLKGHLEKHRTKGERRRQELYETALRLFREKGYEHVSIAEIAKAAGTAKGTFYIYFPTKGDVVKELIKKYDAYYAKKMDELPPDAAPRAAIQEMIWETCELTKKIIGADMIRAVYTNQLLKSPDPDHRDPDCRPVYRITEALLQRGQKQGLITDKYPAWTMAVWLLRAIHSTYYSWSMEGGNFDLSRETRRYIQVLFDGLEIHALQKTDIQA